MFCEKSPSTSVMLTPDGRSHSFTTLSSSLGGSDSRT